MLAVSLLAASHSPHVALSGACCCSPPLLLYRKHVLSPDLLFTGKDVHVCSKSDLKSNAIRQRRHRQRIYEASGEAFLFTTCRECGKPIEPSFKRGFCPRSTGRTCRKNFFKKVQVLTVCRLTLLDHRLSTAVLHV